MLSELTLAFMVMAVCVLIHTAGLVVAADWLLDRRERFEQQRPGMLRFSLYLILVFSAVTGLHLMETAVWAVVYQWWGLFPDFETSLYFSMGSYTTIGYGDVVLQQRWRLLGAVEGVSGVLLCGLSTAFIFVVLNALIQIRARAQADS
ncbi:MAG: potassium channel family protein [Pyrinomonadaceae bacterium]